MAKAKVFCSHPEIFTREERIASNFKFAVKLGRFEEGRLANALELVKNEKHFASKIVEYKTTIVPKRCNCLDHMYRDATCKHMIAVMLEGCIFA